MSNQFPIVNIDEVKAEHPEALIVNMDLEEGEPPAVFAFRRPGREHVSLVTGQSKKIDKALNNMVLSCLIAPSREEAIALFTRYPAAPMSLGNKLLDVVGLKDPELVRP